MKLLSQGEIEKAINKLEKSKRGDAALQIGILAEKGKVPACNLDCALGWYRIALDRGDTRGFPASAVLFWNVDRKDIAVEILNLGARWNEIACRGFLKSQGYDVPQPDLYLDAMEKQRLQEEATAIRKQQLNNALALGLAAGLVAWSAKQQGSANYYQNQMVPAYSAQQAPRRISSSPANAAVSERQILCPDGSYVTGKCRLAPNGRYVGGTPTMAPDGSYVGGTPRITPDGSYVGGNGRITLCPDGSYVAGQCRLAPNGKYVGN